MGEREIPPAFSAARRFFEHSGAKRTVFMETVQFARKNHRFFLKNAVVLFIKKCYNQFLPNVSEMEPDTPKTTARKKEWRAFGMENALNMIVEADRAARERVAEARRRRDALQETLAEQKTAIDAEYDAKAKAQVTEARRQKEEKLSVAAQQIEAREAHIAKALEARFAAGHKSWEDALFQAAVALDD